MLEKKTYWLKDNKMKTFSFLIALLLMSSYGSNTAETAGTVETLALQSSEKCTCGNGIDVYFSDKVPYDGGKGDGMQGVRSQSGADCFAWQEFIALNWPVKAGSKFGTPGDTDRVQWERYMPTDVLYNLTGTAPPKFYTTVSNEYIEKYGGQKVLLDANKTKLLTHSSKITKSVHSNLGSSEAFPFNRPSWLGAQNGTNVWYEIMLNEDYYNYVVKNGFYNAKTQNKVIDKGGFIDFPKGSSDTSIGAIEIKVAWMEVTTPLDSPKWKRFKLSKATVLDPITDSLRTVTVAMVGMHILHKTKSQPTWVWATFEQIDNVPANGVSEPTTGYNFYKSDCKVEEAFDTLSSCPENVAPTYSLSEAVPTPTQVTRVNVPGPNTSVVAVNEKMKTNIKSKYPNSVWQYYELIDVIWAQNHSSCPPEGGATAPVSFAQYSPQSSNAIVANTTLETYVQNSLSCINCHSQHSKIAYFPTGKNHKAFGDFTFTIGSAKYDTNTTSVEGD